MNDKPYSHFMQNFSVSSMNTRRKFGRIALDRAPARLLSIELITIDLDRRGLGRIMVRYGNTRINALIACQTHFRRPALVITPVSIITMIVLDFIAITAIG